MKTAVMLHFAAGHRILGLTGAGAKCRNVHGHTFFATFAFEQRNVWPPPVEFGEVKAVLRGLIKDKYDHTFFVDHADPFLQWLTADNCKRVIIDGPPTTEAIVTMLADDTQLAVPAARLLSVRLDEGPENTATWDAPFTLPDMHHALTDVGGFAVISGGGGSPPTYGPAGGGVSPADYAGYSGLGFRNLNAVHDHAFEDDP